MWVRLPVAVLLVLLAASGPATAAPGEDTAPIGLEVRVSGPGALGDDFGQAVVWNAADGEYLIVWEDHRNEATRGSEIYAHRLNADGVRVGADVRISNSVFDETSPVVVWNETANQYLVVWYDYRNEVNRGFYGRRVGSDGVGVGPDFRISSGGSADEYFQAVGWNSISNRYLVIWRDSRSFDTRGWEIYGRWVGADGLLVGAEFRVSNSTFDETDPALAWNPTDGQFLVVWQDSRSAGARGSEIYGRRLSSGGVPLGANFLISNSTAGEEDPAVAWDGATDQYLVVWEDSRSALAHGWEIYGRRVGAGGARLGGNVRISSSAGTASDPAVVWNRAADQFLVVWADGRSSATRGGEVYGRLMDSAGGLVGGNLRISDSVADEYAPDVAWNGGVNQYLVVWQDSRSAATRGDDIYGRRMTADSAS